MDLFPILEVHKCWHTANPQLVSDVGHFVHVDLVKSDLAVMLAKLLKHGCNHFARRTPGGVAVEDH